MKTSVKGASVNMLSESSGLIRQDSFVEGKIRMEILEVISCSVVTCL